MQPTEGPNQVRVYTASGANLIREFPQSNRNHRKQRRRTAEDEKSVQLLQDFNFPEASNRIQITRDGQYAMATGTYKPQIRVYDFSQMSLKFERHTDAENCSFEILSDDWTKSVHLQLDRTIEFHTQGGLHYKTRIPTFGRDLKYHYPSCDCYITAVGNEVYRLNLEQGRFLKPLVIESATESVNVVDISSAHQLLAFGTNAGIAEFWDPRSRAQTGILHVSNSESSLNNTACAITTLSFHPDGLNLAVGTENGYTLIYDLRSPNQILQKDHGYGLPIKKLIWLNSPTMGTGHDQILAADSKVIKIWNKNNGHLFTAIEPTVNINDVAVVPGTGLIMTANEESQMHAFFIPKLGVAPKWCAHLDSLTEELEEAPSSRIFDNYRFVDRQLLQKLGLEQLIGTKLLRPYMHGFFMDANLFEKAVAIANPYSHEEYRAKLIEDRLAKQRESKIRSSKKPQLNSALAARVSENGSIDERFSSVFKNEEFAVDESSREFMLLNPSTSTAAKPQSNPTKIKKPLKITNIKRPVVEFGSMQKTLGPDVANINLESFADKLRAKSDSKKNSNSTRSNSSVQPEVRVLEGGVKEMVFSVSSEPSQARDTQKSATKSKERRTASNNFFRKNL